MVGDELAKAEPAPPGRAEVREALLFSPDDHRAGRQGRAVSEERSPPARADAPGRPAREERRRARPPRHRRRRSQGGGSRRPTCWRSGTSRFSEARVALRALASLDKDGWSGPSWPTPSAAVPTGCGPRADSAGARPLYQLTAELDPARRRGRSAGPGRPRPRRPRGGQGPTTAAAAHHADRRSRSPGQELLAAPAIRPPRARRWRRGARPLARCRLARGRDRVQSRALEADPTTPPPSPAWPRSPSSARATPTPWITPAGP